MGFLFTVGRLSSKSCLWMTLPHISSSAWFTGYREWGVTPALSVETTEACRLFPGEPPRSCPHPCPCWREGIME